MDPARGRSSVVYGGILTDFLVTFSTEFRNISLTILLRRLLRYSKRGDNSVIQNRTKLG